MCVPASGVFSVFSAPLAFFLDSISSFLFGARFQYVGILSRGGLSFVSSLLYWWAGGVSTWRVFGRSFPRVYAQ